MLELNKLYNMDCMEAMREIPDKYFDLCLTDPPYGVNLNYSTYEDTEKNWYLLMNAFIPEAIRVSKMLIMPSCQIKRLNWFYQNYPPDWIMAWYKGSVGCSSFIGFNDWEALVVYGKSKSQLYMHDYIHIPPDEKMGNYGHPCPKPVRWYEKIISMATKEGDIILDAFAGSGTAAVACHNLNRRFVGFEIDADYHRMATERLEAVRAQMRLY